MADWAKYTGRTAMVTGAGDDIGKMLAIKLAGAGMQVWSSFKAPVRQVGNFEKR